MERNEIGEAGRKTLDVSMCFPLDPGRYSKRQTVDREERWTEGEGTTERTQRQIGRLTGRLTSCEQQGVGGRFHISLVMMTTRRA